MSVAGIAWGIVFTRLADEHLGYSISSAEEICIDDEGIIEKTRGWLETAVIGLNLCPFAAGPYRSGRVRFAVSKQRTAAGLLDDLCAALMELHAAEPAEIETTLLIHPWVLGDFAQFNEFLEACDEALVQLGLEGELQVASFHPHYQFAETSPDDIENYTNRSPFPMLHLLREQSVALAVDAMDTSEISERNVRLLREMGEEGWKNLWRNA